MDVIVERVEVLPDKSVLISFNLDLRQAAQPVADALHDGAAGPVLVAAQAVDQVAQLLDGAVAHGAVLRASPLECGD